MKLSDLVVVYIQQSGSSDIYEMLDDKLTIFTESVIFLTIKFELETSNTELDA